MAGARAVWAVIVAGVLGLSACDRGAAPAASSSTPTPVTEAASSALPAVKPTSGDIPASAAAGPAEGATAIGGMAASPTGGAADKGGAPAPTGGDGAASAPAASASR